MTVVLSLFVVKCIIFSLIIQSQNLHHLQLYLKNNISQYRPTQW